MDDHSRWGTYEGDDELSDMSVSYTHLDVYKRQGESREGALSDGLSDDGHERRAIREQINRAVRENILEREEKKLMTYRGFDLILPAHMMGDNPYIIIAGEGRYRVEMGDTEVGNLIRIDNFIRNLSGHLEKLEISLEKLKERKRI